MITNRAPLSGALPLPPVFTHEQALQSGLTTKQLTGQRFVAISRGIYTLAETETYDLADLCRAFCPTDGSSFISHSTAAQIWGIWLPWRLETMLPLHLSKRGLRRAHAARRNIIAHRSSAEPQHIRKASEFFLSSPEWCWTELASMGLTLPELVAAGDSLLQRADGPRRFADTLVTHPLSTIQRLRGILDTRRTFRGRRQAVAALELIRPGVDSARETLLRLDLIEQGWPEPAINFAVATPSGTRPVDLAFPNAKIAIQYEGAHHRSSEQMTRDIRRDADLEAAGWITVKVDRSFFTPRGRAEFYARLRAAFARRGIVPPGASVPLPVAS